MPAITSKIEVELAGVGNGWTEITADVLSPIRIQYGIQGGGPTDRVASTGTISLRLNNSTQNSAKRRGYYSTIGGREGWTLGVRLRAQFYDPGTSAWYVKFVGSVSTITPIAGLYASQQVLVVATDWIDEAARSTIAGLATQVNKRADEILSLLIGNIPRAPYATALGISTDTYPYALDTTRDDRPNPVLQEIARVTASEMGHFYQAGDGTVTFDERYARVNRAVSLSLSDTMSGLEISSNRDQILSRVQTIIHPRTIDTVTQILYRLQSIPQIADGDTLTLVGGYTDPNSRAQRVGGTSMVTPVATTDYTANSLADGTGTDYTGSITVTATYGSNAARYSITNGAGVPVYLTKLQARGIGIYDYEQTVAEADDPALSATFGEQVQAIDMPYQSNVALGQELATYLLRIFGPQTVANFALGVAGLCELGETTRFADTNYAVVGSVRVSPTTAALQTEILARDIGDVIAIAESMTQIDSRFVINAVDLEVRAPGIPFVTWTLSPYESEPYWLLGTARASKLGETTTLG